MQIHERGAIIAPEIRHWLQHILGPMIREKARALEAQGLPLGPFTGIAWSIRREIIREWEQRLVDILAINGKVSVTQLSPYVTRQIVNTIRAEVGLSPLPPLPPLV